MKMEIVERLMKTFIFSPFEITIHVELERKKTEIPRKDFRRKFQEIEQKIMLVKVEPELDRKPRKYYGINAN